MPDSRRPADVELRIPASSAYASVLRTTTAALAARLDFTMDDIEDLRIAVTEAGTLALQHAAPDTPLTCRFRYFDESLDLTITVEIDGDGEIETDSFAWQVLTTLAEAETRVVEGVLLITVHFQPTPTGPQTFT